MNCAIECIGLKGGFNCCYSCDKHKKCIGICDEIKSGMNPIDCPNIKEDEDEIQG
jgi:hypothetical protein